ncbi:MAG: hypothetical protein M3281_02680 [Chloroflexota bacterium]|nr:hypothetical protein [Chloroflexota bacterium]
MSAIAAARTDLSYRAAVEEHDIIVSQVKAMEFPDASLGCPEPHSTYEQRPTPGYLIVLNAVSREYEYRADVAGHVVYCGKRRQG